MRYGPTDRLRKVGRSKVYAGGTGYDGVGGVPTRTVSLESRSNHNADTQQLLPDNAGGKALKTEIMLDGQTTTFFTGSVGKRTYQVADVGRVVHGLDVLGKLARSAKDSCGMSEGIVFDQTPYPDALQRVLHIAGIDDAQIDLPLPDPGNGVMVVGAVESICIEPDQNLDTVFEELLRMGGCTAFVLPHSGMVRVLPIERIPPENPGIVYDNRNAGAYHYDHAEQTFAGVEDVVNRYTCTGGPVTDGVSVEATWVAQDIEGKADGTQCDYWQTVPQVEWAAEFYGRLACREERLFLVRAPMDPGMLPGRSILLHAPEAGVINTPAYVLSVSTGGNAGTEMTMTCSLGPSQIDGYNQGLLPIADFDMWVVAEYTVLNGQPAVIYDVFCDASLSHDPDGEIVSYEWAITGATPINTVVQDVQTLIVLDTLDGVTITLTVTDNNPEVANTDTLAQQPAAPHIEQYVRVLSTSNGDTWSVLSDMGGWRRYARAGQTCVAVPKYNDAGPLLSLWSDRGIYTTDDYLRTDGALLSTLPGSGALTSGAIFVNEADGDDWLVGAGTVLYRTRDGGQTWRQVSAFSGAITDVELGNDANTGYLRVTGGSTVWHSYSNGAEWEQAAAGAANTTAEAMASAPWGHLTVFTGGAATADATRLDTGELGTVDWSGVTTPPTDLNAVTPGLQTAMFTVADGTALYTLIEQTPEGRDFAAALAATHSGDVAALVRDGRLGGPQGQGIVYGAGTPTCKLLNGELLRNIDLPAHPSTRIGYGELMRREATTQVNALLIIPVNPSSNPPKSGVWVCNLETQTWELRGEATLPTTGGVWEVLSVNPLNPAQWMLLRAGTVSSGSYINGLYQTNDAGHTWAEVQIQRPHDYVENRFAWSPNTNGRWALISHSSSAGKSWIFWGEPDGTFTKSTDLGEGVDSMSGLAFGENDEVVIAGAQSGRSGYVPWQGQAVDNWHVWNVPDTGHTWVQVVPGTRTAIYVQQDATTQQDEVHIWRALDYRSDSPSDLNISINARDLVITASGAGYAAWGTSVKLNKVNDLAGTPTHATINPPTDPSGSLRRSAVDPTGTLVATRALEKTPGDPQRVAWLVDQSGTVSIVNSFPPGSIADLSQGPIGLGSEEIVVA